jgi:hypothetical protein
VIVPADNEVIVLVDIGVNVPVDNDVIVPVGNSVIVPVDNDEIVPVNNDVIVSADNGMIVSTCEPYQHHITTARQRTHDVGNHLQGRLASQEEEVLSKNSELQKLSSENESHATAQTTERASADF